MMDRKMTIELALIGLWALLCLMAYAATFA